MRKVFNLGCRCTPDLQQGFHARCNECGWKFKVVNLIPALDGTLISPVCWKKQGAIIRVPEGQLMAACASAAAGSAPA